MISGEIFSSPTALKNTFRVSFLKKTAEDPVNMAPPTAKLRIYFSTNLPIQK